jgi:ubiquitin fusion degradation protein 1
MQNSDENKMNEDLHTEQLNEDLSEHQQNDDQLSDGSPEDQLSEYSSSDYLPEEEDDEDYWYPPEDEDQNQWNKNLSEDQNQWNKYSYDYIHYAAWQTEVFEHVYRCFPVSGLERPDLENGDKIIMPSSALNSLARLEIEYPMLFELRNPSAERTTHCGVLEFTADEGFVYLPNWMMEDMLLEEGHIVSLKSTSLVKGKFVKFQPHSIDFLDITNPKVMLEKSLRSYSCLTTGRTIMIPYNNKKYYIDVVEMKPFPAISIIETDCEVDFAPPLDYVEPEKPLPSDLSDKEPPQVEEETATKTPAVIPFSGFARRLDGKPSTQSVEQTSTPMLKQQQTENKTTSSNITSGKLVFGSNAKAPNVQTQPKASPKSTSQDLSSKKTDTPQFQAFSGKKYSLRD